MGVEWGIERIEKVYGVHFARNCWGYRTVQPLVLPRRNLEKQVRQVHSKVLALDYVFGHRRSFKL
jgi:hypothetical protein